MKGMSKKAAIEMSMTTIVVIVLSVTILIFGMIFIKNIMCSGVSIVNGLDEKIKNELVSLFGTDNYGVECVGEGATEQSYGDDGTRYIICVINADQAGTYKFKTLGVKKIGSIGESQAEINNWVVSSGVKEVKVVSGIEDVSVLTLEIPKSVSSTNLEIEIEESFKREGTSEFDDVKTHTSHIKIEHVGTVASIIC
jgi:hypothetical protein